LANLLVANYIA